MSSGERSDLPQRAPGEALAGARQVVFVTGETGLGKTTLVNAFLDQARKRFKLWIGRGQCLEQRGPGEPYMPVLEIFGRMCREPGGAEVLALLKERAPTWLAQMPWLVGESEFEVLQRKVVGSTQLRMLREGVEAIELLSARGPTILVLEDLHWSDRSTVDLLSHSPSGRKPPRCW
jgi:predicted ATPase